MAAVRAPNHNGAYLAAPARRAPTKSLSLTGWRRGGVGPATGEPGGDGRPLNTLLMSVHNVTKDDNELFVFKDRSLANPVG